MGPGRLAGRAGTAGFVGMLILAPLPAIGAGEWTSGSGTGAAAYEARVVGADSASPLAPFTAAVFTNGLRAIVKESRGVPAATVDVWVHAGAANEEPGVNGVSHFFEHMFFKGTARFAVGEMDRAIKRLGGRNNAGTSMEWTHYFATVPGESVGVAIDVIAEGILHPALDPAEIERERKVVVEEILRKEDTPSAKVYVLYQRALAPGLPYAQPVLGTRESLEGIDRRAFTNYISAHYVPRNMVVVVTGDVDTRDVLERIRRGFGDAPDAAPPARAEFELPPLTEPRIVQEEKDAKQTYFMMGYPTRGRRERDDMAALDVAAAVLAGGKSSRLYRALVEEGHLLTTVNAWHHALRNGGAFVVEGSGDPAKSEEARMAIREELRRMATALPEAGEVARAKSVLQSGWILDMETTAARAGALGRWELMFGADEALGYEARIEAVSAGDVQRVIRKHVRPELYVMGLITPPAKEEAR